MNTSAAVLALTDDTMKTNRQPDPITEVRRVREEQSARFHHDPRAIVHDAMQRQATHAGRLVDLRKRAKAETTV